MPFPAFPDREGALPWALTDNGDVAYWLTWGDPAEWPVAVWNARGGERDDLIEGGAVIFLAHWLCGDTACSVFPGDANFRNEEKAPRTFDAWRAREHVTIALREIEPPPAGLDTTVYAWRLRALIEALDRVEHRGASGDDDDEERQTHLVAADGAWRITYDTLYGHNVRLAAPADEMAVARARIERAARAMGCAVRLRKNERIASTDRSSREPRRQRRSCPSESGGGSVRAEPASSTCR